MNRPVSPLLHDYKPTSGQPVRTSYPARWFALGLGVPLICVALLLGFNAKPSSAPQAASLEVGGATAASVTSPESLPVDAERTDAAVELAVAPTDAVKDIAPAPIDVPPDFHPPMLLPDMQYVTLELAIQRGDTLDKLFRQHQLNLAHLVQIARLPDTGRYIRVLKPGDVLRVTHHDGNLISVYRELNLTSALVINRGDDGFTSEIVERPVNFERRSAYGKIDSSLFESAMQAGLSDKVIMNLAGLFAWDIDFVYDIRIGDDYYVIYEQIYQDGEYVTDGEIVAAEFNNNGRVFQAIRFVDESGKADYFTPDGRSVRKAFVRAPVDFTRISSNFNPRRRHPILNTIRAHRGVDYAAPSGTPIKAAGDGKVIHRGRKNGYGNAVILQHGGNITTLYAHMSNFDRNAPLGRRVKQGQVIGYVGSTGLATAPHLHYEYRLNGVHRNPRTVPLPQAEPIRDEYRNEYLTYAKPILDELSRYKRMQIASASFE